MPGQASHPSQDKSVGLANPGIMSVHYPEWDLTVSLSNNFSTWHTGGPCHLNTQILWVKRATTEDLWINKSLLGFNFQC
jgi:hypothetical protein